MSTITIHNKQEAASTERSTLKVYKHKDFIIQRNLSSVIGKFSTKIGFKTSTGVHIINYESILRCESIENYCRVHLCDGTNLFLSKTLKSVQEVLCSKSFYRVHKSHLVSLHNIDRIDNQEIKLSDGTMVPLSRRKKVEFLDYIHQLIAVV